MAQCTDCFETIDVRGLCACNRGETETELKLRTLCLQRTGSLTVSYEELVAACRNINYDLTCGACAELFFTGVRHSNHEKRCITPKDRI